jgi:predicted ATPase
MIRRFYAHNFRCLVNFELLLEDKPSALLIGKNGSGKSTIAAALSVLQSVGRGVNRVAQLVTPRDLARGDAKSPMRFEIEVVLEGRRHEYRLALGRPAEGKELVVVEESLAVDGETRFARAASEVSLGAQSRAREPSFLVDLRLIALTIIQEQSESDPLAVLKRWLAHSILLAPTPSLIDGESAGESLEPRRDARNLGAWFAGLIAQSPAAYGVLAKHLKTVLPDFKAIKNPLIGAESRSLSIQFVSASGEEMSLPFAALSDGEKCFFLCALVIAANEAYGPVFCFWDEPDSHLSIDEVQQFVASLRRSFESGGQILIASHNAEAIRAFSDENTFVVFRRSHFEPTQLRLLEAIEHSGDLIDRIVNGELEP